MYKQFANLSDEELAVRAQHGDHAAEEVLMNRYKDLVRGRAHLYFIVGADSEDVMQEGMIGLFKAVQGYENGKNASFRTFANLCINRQIISAIKTASRDKHEPLNSSISLDMAVDSKDDDGNKSMEDILASPYDTPEELMLARDMLERIIIETPQFLSKFEQKVWSAYLAGKNYSEIAEMLGKEPKSIDNAIQRIRAKVAKLFK